MEYRKLGALSEFIMGQAPSSKECNKTNIGTPFVKAGQFGELYPVINEWTTKPLKMAQEKDVIICVVGATAGKLNLGLNVAIGRSVSAIRCKEDKLYYKYLYYYLTTWLSRIRERSQGSAIGVITKDMLYDIDIPFVDLKKQIMVIEILDKAQELIDKRKAQIEELDELIKSVFYDMFLHSINDIKCHELIKDCIDFIDYRGKTPEKTNEGVKLITAKNVGFGYYKEKPREYISQDLYEKSMTRGYPKANDVLFATEGATLGYVARIPRNYRKFAVGQRLITMVCKCNIKPEYLEKYMITQYFQNDVNKKATGSSAKGIRSSELKEIKIPIPPKELQEKFSIIVEQIEKQKEVLQKSLSELEDNFNSLMQKSFKGELFN